MAASNSSAGGGAGAGAASGRFGESAPAATLTDIWGETIIKLRLIARVQPGQKINSATFTISNAGIYSWAVRKLTGDNASACVASLREFYLGVFEDLAALPADADCATIGPFKARLAALIRASVPGLQALAETYSHENHIVAQLDYIRDDIIAVHVAVAQQQ